MTIAALRKEVRKLRDQIGLNADVGRIVVLDPNEWDEEDHMAYLAAEGWDEQHRVIERITGEPFVTHANRGKHGQPGVSVIEIVLDPEDDATE